MILKRICLAALMFSLGVAGNAQAAQYALATGSGAQLHIGNGLALPIQQAIGDLGPVFPPLLIGPKKGVGVISIAGTTVMASNQQITVPKSALSKPAVQTTVGLFFSNPTLYAVGTNLNYVWPTAPAVFSEFGRPGAQTVTIAGAEPGNTIRYSNRVTGKRFGGAGTFALNPGPPAGLHSGSPVTIYALGGGAAGLPPCTHPLFGGTNTACLGALIDALATGVIGAGQATGAIVTTPGGVSRTVFTFTPNGNEGPVVTPNGTFGPHPAFSGIAAGEFGTAPLGTVINAVLVGPVNNGLTNMALSDGFPFTTAKITISAMNANGGAEKWVISGDDNRTAGGAGTIQMVAGSLSARPLSGPNANRAWVRLVLVKLPPVPTMSPLVIGIAIVLMMLVPTVYFARRARNQAV